VLIAPIVAQNVAAQRSDIKAIRLTLERLDFSFRNARSARDA
jgi:hypothetical protein